MAKVYLILVLIVQSTLVFAETESNSKENKEETTSREILKEKPDEVDKIDKDCHDGNKDWMDMFLLPIPNNNFYPTSSVAMMSQVTDCNKTAEEQLEDIKEMANKITLAIQSEMANLLSYALSHCEKEDIENNLRKKRETPMDSSELVMRLLKHIKANNEYQNIAIEKMMSAQEIADKFGIEFNADPDMLSDLAFAANEQAKEMTSILKDACDAKNSSMNVAEEQIEYVPVESVEQCPTENNTYYVYSVHHPEQEEFLGQHPHPPHNYMSEYHNGPAPRNYGHHEHPHHHNHYDQMPPSHHQLPPVTPKPNFHDFIMPFAPEFYPYCPVEPITTTTTIVLPIEEVIEPEPELIGEEYEETVSSKMIVNRDEEPGTATVNHVMTYTLSEKAHFRKPEIEKMPEQMQYTFFLM